MVSNLIRDADWLSSSIKIKTMIRNHGTSLKIFIAMMTLTKKELRKVKHECGDVDDIVMSAT